MPVRRRLSRHALSRRRAVASERTRLAREARPRLERLRRIDHGRRARSALDSLEVLEWRRAQLRRRARRANPRACRQDDRRVGGARRHPDPGRSVAQLVAAAYRKHLFKTATLQDLPDAPRFVINATNLQTGGAVALLGSHGRLHSQARAEPDRRARERRRRVVGIPADPLAAALEARTGVVRDQKAAARDFTEPFDTHAVLSDGGVASSLGLETAWKSCKTVLVSDGGGRM